MVALPAAHVKPERAMQIKFPVQIIWERTTPGSRSPIMVEIEGRKCVAVFETDKELMLYRLAVEFENQDMDQRDFKTAGQLRAFLSISTGKYLVVNPRSPSERIYDLEEVRKHLGELQ
jgi:hypothetical protein